MEIGSVIIDTNAYAAFKKGEKKAVEVIENCDTVFISSIVIGELLSGFVLGSKEKRNRNELAEFLNLEKVRQINVDNATAEYLAQIFKELKRKGKPIPTNDMWIAAAAKQYQLKVFSYDSHFRNIDALVVIP